MSNDKSQRDLEYAAMLDNLTHTQKRCSELFDITRAQRYFKDSITASILNDVLAERFRQDLKWSSVAEKWLNTPDGTGSGESKVYMLIAKDKCDRAMADGTVSWNDILDEEWAETAAEADVDKLRKELIQVASVACRWVEAIDLRRQK